MFFNCLAAHCDVCLYTYQVSDRLFRDRWMTSHTFWHQICLKNSATSNLCLLRKIKEFYMVYNLGNNKCFSEFCLLCYLPSIEPTYLHITNYLEILIFLCCTIPTWRFYCLSLNRNFNSLPHKVESVLIKKISLMQDFFLKNNFFY